MHHKSVVNNRQLRVQKKEKKRKEKKRLSYTASAQLPNIKPTVVTKTKRIPYPYPYPYHTSLKQEMKSYTFIVERRVN